MDLTDRRVDLHPGVCFWMRPGGKYVSEQNLDDRLGVTFCHFDLVESSTGERIDHALLPQEAFDLPDVTYIDALTRRIVSLSQPGDSTTTESQKSGRRDVASQLMRGLLMDLEQLGRRKPEIAGLERHHRDMVLDVASQINEEPRDVPSVAELAKRVGYSADHFARVFRDVTGSSPREFIVQARINRARILLTESSLTVSQIAHALGYEDIYFFSRQFKAKTGVSPTGFRDGKTPKADPGSLG